MGIPLVKVTARVQDQQGRACSGAVVRMRLCSPEKYQGLVVPRETSAVTDANGVAELRVFPNALGYEGSEYDVHISFPAPGIGVCGRGDALPVLRPVRAHAVVPNSDCNLFDILNLPPYEQRGAGAVLASEVAGYASDAADSALAARQSAQKLDAALAEAKAAASAAAISKSEAEAASEECGELLHSVRQRSTEVDAKICEWVKYGTETVEKSVGTIVADARACIAQDKADALAAVELRASEALAEATETISNARTEAVVAVNEAGATAVHHVEDARDNAREELRDMAGQFEEDFLTLAERAESSAKRAGCASTAAANSAAKACECARRAEDASDKAVKAKDEAEDAARRAKASEACVRADAQRAEAAAESARKSADHAEGSAKAAQKAAQAADASAEDANLAARQAVEAQQAARADKDYVAGVAGDVEKAIHDAALDMLTPQVVSDAIDKATEEARRHAGEAAESARESRASATESTRQANLAKKRAEAAEAAQAGAEAARDEAGEHAREARDAAQQAACAADRAASKAEDVMARMADGKISVWTLPNLVAEGDLLTLPPGIGYYPGHCAVRLSWDGLVCHVGRNFEEVGEAGILSNAVRLLFNAPAGSEFQAEIMAHADAPGAGEVSDLLEKRLAAIEKNLSRLDRDAVRFTPAHP